MYKKKGLPEVDELVVCTIKEVTPHSVSVDLDEYDAKEGIIHASEMNRRTVRNIKALLKVGSKKICKVMDINSEKGQVNLSLRRVGAGQERSKMHQWKNEKTANDVLEVFARDQKMKIEDLHKNLFDKLVEQYKEMYPVFIEVAKDGSGILIDAGVPANIADPLTELIQKRITIPEKEITGKITLISNASNGLAIIKNAIDKINELAKKDNIKSELKYLGAPSYKFYFSSSDPKAVDRFITKLTGEMEKFMQKNEGKFQIELEANKD